MKELVEDLKIANDNLYCANKMLEKDNKRLQNTIKEVREYIEENEYSFIDKHGNIQDITQFLEILEGE